MHLEELVSKNYVNLKENDHYVWSYIMEHKKECEHLSIEELAKRCHVSRTTILRFAKRLGLKGYAELKVYIRMMNEQVNDAYSSLELACHTYHEYMNMLMRKDVSNILKMIDYAKNCYVYGTGNVQNTVAREIKRLFLEVGKLFFVIRSMNETASFVKIIDQEDVMILISYSGENQGLLEFAKQLKTKGVKIISICATKNNTLSHYADEALYVDCPNLMNPIGPRHEGLVNYFILVEFLLIRFIELKTKGINVL